MITILDENDNRPVFTRTSYRAEVTENSEAGGNGTAAVCSMFSMSGEKLAKALDELYCL